MSFITEHNNKHKNFRPIRNIINAKVSFYGIDAYEGCFISSGANIGKGTVVYPGAVICDNVTIGENCIIGPNSVIGAEGFTSRIEEGQAILMKNVGSVSIGNNVDIGANTCIDRGSLEDSCTTIGDRVKIDNLCHIAHNVKIGNDTRIAPTSVFGGTTTIGERVWIGIGVITKEHVAIGDDAFVCMGSVVISDIGANEKVAGYYATSNNDWNKFSSAVKAGIF